MRPAPQQFVRVTGVIAQDPQRHHGHHRAARPETAVHPPPIPAISDGGRDRSGERTHQEDPRTPRRQGHRAPARGHGSGDGDIRPHIVERVPESRQHPRHRQRRVAADTGGQRRGHHDERHSPDHREATTDSIAHAPSRQRRQAGAAEVEAHQQSHVPAVDAQVGPQRGGHEPRHVAVRGVEGDRQCAGTDDDRRRAEAGRAQLSSPSSGIPVPMSTG